MVFASDGSFLTIINLVSLSVRATEGDLVSLRARALSERREKSTGSDKLRGSDLPIMRRMERTCWVERGATKYFAST